MAPSRDVDSPTTARRSFADIVETAKANSVKRPRAAN